MASRAAHHAEPSWIGRPGAPSAPLPAAPSTSEIAPTPIPKRRPNPSGRRRCTHGESESVGEGRRDRLQLVADRGVRALRQRQTFSGPLQSLVNDALSTPAIRELARADDVCDECVGDIHSFTIMLVIPRIQGSSRNESRLLAPHRPRSALYSRQHKLSPGARLTGREASHRRRGSTGRTATRT